MDTFTGFGLLSLVYGLWVRQYLYIFSSYIIYDKDDDDDDCAGILDFASLILWISLVLILGILLICTSTGLLIKNHCIQCLALIMIDELI